METVQREEKMLINQRCIRCILRVYVHLLKFVGLYRDQVRYKLRPWYASLRSRARRSQTYCTGSYGTSSGSRKSNYRFGPGSYLGIFVAIKKNTVRYKKKQVITISFSELFLVFDSTDPAAPDPEH